MSSIIQKIIERESEENILKALEQLGNEAKEVKDEYDITLLHYATTYGCSNKILEQMINLGCDINSKDSNGNIPVHYCWESTASKDSYLAYINQTNLKINTVNNFGDSPLLYAISAKSSNECIKNLLDKKVILNHPNERSITPLLEAIRAKYDLEILKLLVKKGSKVDVVDERGCNVLHFCAEFKQPLSVFQYFDEFNLNYDTPNEWKLIPLALALDNQLEYDTLNFLIDKTNDLNVLSYDNNTLLHYSCMRDIDHNITKKLIDRDILINHKDDYGNIPLHKLCQRNGDYKIATLLIEAGSDLESKNGVGDTPLHCVARYNGSPKLAEVLIEHGAEVNSIADWNKTPLHIAYEYNSSEELINILIEYGADNSYLDINQKIPSDFKKN